jgi:hypothetical protein
VGWFLSPWDPPTLDALRLPEFQDALDLLEREGGGDCALTRAVRARVAGTLSERAFDDARQNHQTQRMKNIPPPPPPERPVMTVGAGTDIYAVTPEHIARCNIQGDFLVDGLLVRKQITLVASIPKGGKSTLTTAIVRDLLVGGLCLDRKTHLQPDEDILWLVEEPRDVFIHRLVHEFGVPAEVLGTRLLVAYRRELRAPQNWPSFMADLILKLVARREATARRIGLVIIDTFSAWTGLEGDQEKQEGAINQAFAPIGQLADATGAAVLVNHHTRKAGGEDGLSVRGSTAITASVDTIVEVQRPAKNTKGLKGLSGVTRRSIRKLHALGRLRETNWLEGVHFRQSTTEYTVLSLFGDGSDETSDSDETATTPDAAISADQRQVITQVAQAGDEGLLRAKLVEALGLSKDKVGRLVRALAEAGRVQVSGGRGQRQRVIITKAGREVVNTRETTSAER